MYCGSPYQLKGLEIVRPNHVWMTDITYILMSKGFIYKVAFIYVCSRYIVGWDISYTMPASWVCRVIENAIKEHGAPEILNSDQGFRFTGVEYRKLLGRYNIRIFMDGKGRALDTIYIERFWRTQKYEKIYLELPSEVTDPYSMLNDNILYCNMERIHTSVNNQPPRLWFTDA
jgi:putative transposase